ncbi:MAG: hypothetical protein HUU34_23185 [Saprospiraceae bacterium]|nr:hypothetical protein [Saprospiraceae bacterium]
MQIFPQPPFPDEWFREVSMGITCSAICPIDESAVREATELDNAVADESLNPGGLPGYLLKRFLYKDLLYYPQLLQGNTNLQNFQNSFGNMNGGKLVSAEKNMSDGFGLTTPQQNQWDAALNDLNAAFEQWNELDSLLQNGADPAAQETERGTLTQQFSTAQTALQSIYQDNLTARINSVAAIQQTLDGVNPAAVWESNEKTLDSIFLHTAYINGVPNPTQTGQILQIAEQCSADGGPAVFRAKAWYFSLTGTRVEVNCGGEIERGSNDKALPETTGTLAVSPNPATNMLLVRIRPSKYIFPIPVSNCMAITPQSH